jgi:hypothetical protein
MPFHVFQENLIIFSSEKALHISTLQLVHKVGGFAVRIYGDAIDWCWDKCCIEWDMFSSRFCCK